MFIAMMQRLLILSVICIDRRVVALEATWLAALDKCLWGEEFLPACLYIQVKAKCCLAPVADDLWENICISCFVDFVRIHATSLCILSAREGRPCQNPGCVWLLWLWLDIQKNWLACFDRIDISPNIRLSCAFISLPWLQTAAAVSLQLQEIIFLII